MKKILITGANSYIGTSFEQYLRQWPEKYDVTTIDMIDGSWRQKKFHGYDVVFYVAGIAHMKETDENRHLYYEINRDLTEETAEKSKREGVKQFVFLSSMSVYGLDIGVITPKTEPNPKTHYGKSKLQAEQLLSTLSTGDFKVAILRPPMVYGKGCKGNFTKLINYVSKYSIFPKVENRRSMIYIETLCDYVRSIISQEKAGLFFPQNHDYVQTAQMVQWIAEAMGKKIKLSKIFGIGIYCIYPFSKIIQKAFGTLIYQGFEELSDIYIDVSLESTVKKSV